MSITLTMLAVGDVAIRRANPESIFALAAPTLRSSDVVIGQAEVPITARGVNMHTEIASSPCDPRSVSALPYAGFNVMTLAGNHIWDSGLPGVEDTIDELRKCGMAVVGAGMNIDEARKPLVIERKGTRFGFLDYNCVGPKESWATPDKPGCAYVEIVSHYEAPPGSPGGPPIAYTFAEPSSLAAMEDQVQKLRPLCDVLVVAFHKGLLHTPIKIAMYDRQVSHAVIDAGADVVLGHHAHILKGIELYKGKPIFHGLCNFGMDLQKLSDSKGQALNWFDQQWKKRRRELYGFVPDPEYPTYPFHPEAKQTIIAKCVVKDGKVSRVGYVPCLVNKLGQPEVLKNDDRGKSVFDYMDKITKLADLNAHYKWDGDEVLVDSD